MIHNGFAFTGNEFEKRDENLAEFKKLQTEHKFEIIKRTSGYNHIIFQIQAKKPFTGVEMLLYADKGNLCFGGFFEGHDDLNKVNQPGKYTCTVFTD